MIPITITNFREVILFHLQAKLRSGQPGEMTYGEIWRACEQAAPNFLLPMNPHRERRQFIARVLDDIHRLDLETKISVVTLEGDRIDHIRVTEWGREYLSTVDFTNTGSVIK